MELRSRRRLSSPKEDGKVLSSQFSELFCFFVFFFCGFFFTVFVCGLVLKVCLVSERVLENMGTRKVSVRILSVSAAYLFCLSDAYFLKN